MSVPAHFAINNRELLLQEPTTDHEVEIQNAASMDYICSESSGEYSMFLQYQLMVRYVWTGSFRSDYWFHVCNFHPLLACFFCHPAHPYSRREHQGVLVITIAWTTALTAYVFRQSQDKPPEGLWGQVLILIFVTIPVLIIHAICEGMILGDWLLEYGADQWKAKTTRCASFTSFTKQLSDWVRQFESVKENVLTFNVVLSLILAFVAFVIINFNSGVWTAVGDCVVPVFRSQLYSWIGWFFSDAPMFCFNWTGERYVWGS